MRIARAIIPNAISLSRIPLGIAFLLLYDDGVRQRYLAAVAIAILAILTDLADGRLARRWHVASATGGLIDGLGDKAFYIAVYLVIAAEHAADSLLLWLLIFREVALYGLRTIDEEKVKHIAQLRWASLTYAFVIRIYFLWFLVEGGLTAFDWGTIPLLSSGHLLGYLAAVLGYVGLARLVQEINASD